MQALVPPLIREFLSRKRIAVAGVSRDSKGSPANAIYRKLSDSGYVVSAVNPKSEVVEGEVCYPDLKSIPELPEAVVTVTQPEATMSVARQCAELGIDLLWMHQSFRMLGTSVSEEAVRFCEERGIKVIRGACPMMFVEPVDVAHKCGRWLLRATGSLPK
ncbi:MAG: CoA-binding protein [Candidatus Hydrogenedentes bacterium]|nr:CoA-binding protein [Candidatus Hydrogenedentota bacterium]